MVNQGRAKIQTPEFDLGVSSSKKCQVFVREDLEHRVTTWAIMAFIAENPSVRAHSSNH